MVQSLSLPANLVKQHVSRDLNETLVPEVVSEFLLESVKPSLNWVFVIANVVITHRNAHLDEEVVSVFDDVIVVALVNVVEPSVARKDDQLLRSTRRPKFISKL